MRSSTARIGGALPGVIFSAAPRHQLRQLACQSSFAPFGEDRDQSRIFAASRSIRWGGSPWSIASCRHSGGSCQSAGRRTAFFWTPLGVFSFGVVGWVRGVSFGVWGLSLGEGRSVAFPPTSADFRRALRSRSLIRRRSAASSGMSTAALSDNASAVRPIRSGSTPERTMSAIKAATSVTLPRPSTSFAHHEPHGARTPLCDLPR